MAVIRCLTQYQGKVCCRSNQLKMAKVRGEPLTFVHDRKSMTIKPSDIDNMIAGKYGPIKDNYGPGQHYIYYFNWKPDNEQGELLQ